MSNKILLADDSVTIQKVTELTFMDSDFEVVAVSNGDDALSRLATVNPDLVIADVHMPGADGYEVCRRTKEHDSTVPVLLLAGMFEPFDEGEASSCGADAHLKKPFDSQELLALVKRLHAERPSSSAPSAGDASDTRATTGETEDPGEETSALDAVPGERDEPVWGNLELASETQAGADAENSVLADSPTAGGPAGEEVADDRPFGTLITPTMQTVGNVAAGNDDEPFGTMITPALEVEPKAEPVAEFVSSEPQASDSAPEPLPEAVPEVVPEPVQTEESSGPVSAPTVPLSNDDVDRIARRIIELLGDEPVREVAWEVIPDLAEVVIKERIRQLEAQAEA